MPTRNFTDRGWPCREGLPLITLISGAERNAFVNSQQGSIGTLRMYSTGAISTRVCLHYSNSAFGGEPGWFCLAEVIATEMIDLGSRDKFSEHKVTFRVLSKRQQAY